MGLLAMVVLTMGIIGCGSETSEGISAEDMDVFITDRVVTVRIVMKEEDWTACQVNALARQYVPADFWFDSELVSDVAIRPKGHSSLRQAFDSGSPRFSLKVDFNLFNRARNFRGLKKLNFNNGFSDPTFIRERLAYELFEQIGIPTPRSSFVDLWVNDTHLGLYTMVEQIDKTFLSRHFAGNDGNLYKPEMPAAYLNWTEADLEEHGARWGAVGWGDPGSGMDVNLGGGKLREIMQALEQHEPAAGEASTIGPPGPPPGMPSPPGATSGLQGSYLEIMGLKTNENSPDHSALLHFLDILNNEPDETFPAEIEKVLDVDEVLRFLAVSTLVVHLDNYLGLGHNYYLYETGGKFTILPWDLNMAFGTFNCTLGRDSLINFYIDEPTCGPIAERPLIHRLLSYPPYLDVYHGYLETLLDGPFSVDVMESRVDELADLIRPYVEADELKFFSIGEFERGLTGDTRGIRTLPDILTKDMPLGVSQLSPESLSCLEEQFDRSTLEELRIRRPTTDELEKLRSCLTREELLEYLWNAFDMMTPPLGQTALGLKSFVAARSASVRQQLAGEQLSAGDGSGNKGARRKRRR